MSSLSLFALLDMVPSPDVSPSPPLPAPVGLDPLNTCKPAAPQDSALFRLPDDVFQCVLDYLGRDEAWSLVRVCRGLARSETLMQRLYRYPIQLGDVGDMRLGEWKYRASGLLRWQAFQASINNTNRGYVHKLAVSHWASIDDFRWIDANLPALASLDLSAIKDFTWSPEQTWTWRMLADAVPALFARLAELDVANWADYTAHARIEYSYAYNDYRFKQKFRLSRRRAGSGSVAKELFPLCTRLDTLAVRERYSGFHTWNEWEVHQRVCCLVDGIQAHCPPTLTTLRVHDYAPYRALFSTHATAWPNLARVDMDLYAWLEDRRDRDVIGPIPYRIAQGHHHRDEEEAFDDKTFDHCARDHMALGKHVVQGVGASFEDLLQSLHTISANYPHIHFRPTRSLDSMTLHPFHLINVMRRRRHLAHNNPRSNSPPPDPCANQDVQHAIRWLLHNCHWKPTLTWDSMMCDVFPANLEPTRVLLAKPDLIARIRSMVTTLRSLDIPIRIAIGDLGCAPPHGLDGTLYFGDYKTLTGTGDDQVEQLLPTQASFNLSSIAPLVDELTIQYPFDSPTPGTIGFLRPNRRQSPAEKALFDREMTGWRRFWARYAHQFTALKKLTVNVPREIYNDWEKSSLPALLHDDRWEMLQVKEQHPHLRLLDTFITTALRSGIRRRNRAHFVQRVFFRLDARPLALEDKHPALDALARDDRYISDAEIADQDHAGHRFWPRDDSSDSHTNTHTNTHTNKRRAPSVPPTIPSDDTQSKKPRLDHDHA